MYIAYKNGGVLLGVAETFKSALPLLDGHTVGWVSCNGQIIHMKKPERVRD